MKFPSAEARLSEGCEKSSSIKTLEMILKFFKAASLLQQPLEELIGECLANFLVADMMFHGLQELQSNLGSQGWFSMEQVPLLFVYLIVENATNLTKA
ncbi:hypothetical protein Peur_036177 [Populus x canadensis]|jgi:hypothetical protein